MASLGSQIGSFMRFKLTANPPLSQDAQDVLVYLLSCTTNGDVRFTFAKKSTVMEELGWRNLDRVDSAYNELERHGILATGVGTNNFKKKQGAEAARVEGWFIYADPRKNPAVRFTQPTPEDVEFQREVMEKAKRYVSDRIDERIKAGQPRPHFIESRFAEYCKIPDILAARAELEGQNYGYDKTLRIGAQVGERYMECEPTTKTW